MFRHHGELELARMRTCYVKDGGGCTSKATSCGLGCIRVQWELIVTSDASCMCFLFMWQALYLHGDALTVASSELLSADTITSKMKGCVYVWIHTCRRAEELHELAGCFWSSKQS